MRCMKLPGRRAILAGLALSLAKPALSAPSEATAGTLLVAGPPGGRLDSWAGLFAPLLGRSMPARTPMELQNVGGIDGVTGANQFEALVVPDGGTALLVPGSAALSWLAGETRAQFDPAHWVPLWAATNAAVLVSRNALVPGSKLRVAAASPAGPELPALLALDLMGITAILSPAASAEASVIRGPSFNEGLLAASFAGFQPVMTLGNPGTGQAGRDPRLPTVPTALELILNRAPPDLLAALMAAQTAAQLDAGLVLPALTPAASVASWRRACLALQQDPEIRREAARLGTRLIPADAVATCTSGIAGNSSTVLALRRWLATRHDWRPA